MKPLEALERIKKANYFVDFELNVKVGKDYKDEINIVEKSLKALEIIKRELNVDEILFSLKGVVSAKDYDLVKEVLL